eukprot:CAMPEP_0172492776 /NCGR_PEP_ID=MMETSP1066-20121228/24023_1 /TAXON_ID=671091 /ORGANISM="Coscinodiscus wailesii, Strain CCMP2513" /LENGTH=45 /DNA_ID= /DNA_START= /DNA_END= /DNA_ORIENTATION=
MATVPNEEDIAGFENCKKVSHVFMRARGQNGDEVIRNHNTESELL